MQITLSRGNHNVVRLSLNIAYSKSLHVRQTSIAAINNTSVLPQHTRTAMAPTDKPCCIGTVKQGELKGKNVELGPLTTYVTGTEHAGGAAILIIPDIFGFSIPNTR